MEYLMEVLGSTPKPNFNILHVVQNKLVQTLSKYDYLTSSKQLLEKLKTFLKYVTVITYSIIIL